MQKNKWKNNNCFLHHWMCFQRESEGAGGEEQWGAGSGHCSERETGGATAESAAGTTHKHELNTPYSHISTILKHCVLSWVGTAGCGH